MSTHTPSSPLQSFFLTGPASSSTGDHFALLSSHVGIPHFLCCGTARLGSAVPAQRGVPARTPAPLPRAGGERGSAAGTANPARTGAH